MIRLAFDRSVPEAEVFRCDSTKWHVDAQCCDTAKNPGLHSCNTAPVAQWLSVKQQSEVFWRYCKAETMPNCCFSHPGVSFLLFASPNEVRPIQPAVSLMLVAAQDELQGEMFYCTEEAMVRRT